MDTVTSSVTVGPSKVALERGTGSPGRGTVGEFGHDLGDSDRVGPRTVSDSVTASNGIRHVRAILLVEIDTVPALGEVGLDLHTIGTISIKVEVVGSDTSLVGRWVDLTSEKESETVGSLAVGVTGKHPQSIGERRDGLVGRRLLQEVVESLVAGDGSKGGTAVVDPEQLWHPVVTLVGRNRASGTLGLLVFGTVVGSAKSGSTDNGVKMTGDTVGVDNGVESLVNELVDVIHVPSRVVTLPVGEGKVACSLSEGSLQQGE